MVVQALDLWKMTRQCLGVHRNASDPMCLIRQSRHRLFVTGFAALFTVVFYISLFFRFVVSLSGGIL